MPSTHFILLEFLAKNVTPFSSIQLSLIDYIEVEHQEIAVAVRVIR